VVPLDRRSGSLAPRLAPNGKTDAIDVALHLIAAEAKRPEALLGKVPIPLHISGGLGILSAIDLDDQLPS
jgi:hypothetical protein